MSAPLHWEVIAVLASGQGVGRCYHEHATADEATMCPWTPDPWPAVCDLLVRQVRTGQREQLSLEPIIALHEACDRDEA